jgi:hypothetical protein
MGEDCSVPSGHRPRRDVPARPRHRAHHRGDGGTSLPEGHPRGAFRDSTPEPATPQLLRWRSEHSHWTNGSRLGAH